MVKDKEAGMLQSTGLHTVRHDSDYTTMVILFLVFWEASILFSTVVVSIYILTDNVQGFPHLHILAYICYL